MAWELSFSGTFAWEGLRQIRLGLSLGNFVLRTLAEDRCLGISGWGAEAWGTGLLRLGEPLGQGAGGPRLGRRPPLAFKRLFENPLGNLVREQQENAIFSPVNPTQVG